MRFKGAALIAVVLSMLMSVSMFAQQDGGDQAEMMKAWENYMKPGEAHKMMAKAEGKWKTTTKYWMAPGGEPQVSEGEAHAEMIFGGRYLQTNYHGKAMGMPFEGFSLEGYDNAKGVYQTIWVDNMGTGITMAEGVYDADAKEYVMHGTYVNPQTKEDVKYTNKVRIISDDEFVFEMYMHGPDGSEFKTMEMLHERIVEEVK